jgi:hypothetical protein
MLRKLVWPIYEKMGIIPVVNSEIHAPLPLAQRPRD